MESDVANIQGPTLFLSYSHADDRDGYITDLRKALEIEVQVQTGKRLTIFQDADIKVGQDFQAVIETALDQVLLFVPVVSPSYFNSEYCKKELSLFLKRESKLGRQDLVIPIYYVEYDVWDEEHLLGLAEHRLEKAVKRHQYRTGGSFGLSC